MKRPKPQERIRVTWITREGQRRSLVIYPSNLLTFHRSVEAVGGTVSDEVESA